MPTGQDQNQTTNTQDPTPIVPPLGANAPDVDNSAPSETPSEAPAAEPSEAPEKPATSSPSSSQLSLMADIAGKILDAHNILIALSSDPSVDEMAAAIGLSICLDRAGKRATAIYSGTTPNALEFLKPEDTFETSSDTLQDFVIALNKEKADHLRYKLDGDFVKIFITPYKSRISDEDLEFSYGDFNIDLVLSLNVANGVDLDGALREHGRIMHDATVINITTGNPGKFGEVEWSDKSASSVSEMVSRLLFSMSRKVPIEAEDATAFLTGIVAATNRFSNNKTTPDAMKIASRLLESGANQQLISKNITSDFDNDFYAPATPAAASIREKAPSDTSLDITHGEEETPASEEEKPEEGIALPEVPAELTLETPAEPAPSTSEAPATDGTLNVASAEPAPEFKLEPAPEPAAPADQPAVPELPRVDDNLIPVPEGIENAAEKVVAPSASFLNDAPESANRYGQMLEEALAEPEPAPVVNNPMATPTANNMATIPEIPAQPQPATPLDLAAALNTSNPAASLAPQVAAAPEINGVPEMNYMPMPDEGILPPPPTPPIDMNSANPLPPTDATNVVAPAPAAPNISAPDLNNSATVVQPDVPGATAPISPIAPSQPVSTSDFKIPGM